MIRFIQDGWSKVELSTHMNKGRVLMCVNQAAVLPQGTMKMVSCINNKDRGVLSREK